ncbi:MFS transporter, partial [Limosilactobacillus mucosae]|nr:MFS transporter [Limosilactobacillus mucosae]
IGAFFKMPNFSKPRPIKIDLVSVLISLIGSSLILGSLTVFEINLLAGLAMLIVGLIIMWYFVKRQLHMADPMLKVQIVRYPSFRMMTAVGCCAFMILLGTEQLLPIFTQNVMHVGSFKSGLILLPGALCNALVAPIAGRLYDQYGPKWLITTGGILTLLASIPLVNVNAHMPIWVLTVAYMTRLIGNAFLFNPALSEAFSQLAPNENSHGTALNNTLRQACGAASVTLLVVISGLPASLTTGVRAAMWVTVGLAILMLVIFYRYLGWKKRQQG